MTAEQLVEKALFDLASTMLRGDPDAFQPTAPQMPESVESRIRASVLEHLFDGAGGGGKRMASESDVFNHIWGRYALFSAHLLPWLRRIRPDLSGAVAIEVGCGTGASSAAFAPSLAELHAYEIDSRALPVWRDRMAAHEIANATLHDELFSSKCKFVKSGNKADLIIFCAVLEHLTDREFSEIVKVAWETLKPGGLIMVADTPNRYAPVDYHTSLLPAWSTLQDRKKIAYGAAFSPRDDFRAAMASLQVCRDEDASITLARWGRGISYHDLELELGMAIHSHVVLDGFEPEIVSACSISAAEGLLKMQASLSGKGHISNAFTRPNLYFVLEKPSNW